MTYTSFSRLGTANAYDTSVRNIQQREVALSNAQERLTSGKKINTPSDDPTGAAQAERALTRINRIATDQRALTNQRNNIANAESTLGDVNTALQSFRTLVVSAGDAAYSASDRQAVVAQLQGLRNQIFDLSNTKDTNGLPLFSALGSALTPFTGPNGTAPDYTFNGLPGQTASSQTGISSNMDGASAFMLQASRDGVYNVTLSNTTTGAIPATRSLQSSNVTVTNPTLVNGSAYTLSVSGVDTTTTPGTTTVTYDITENPNVGGPYTGLTASFPTSSTGGSFTVTAMPGLSMTLTGSPAVGDTATVQPAASLFSVLDNAIRDIGSASNTGAATQAVNQALAALDVGMSRVSAVRGQAGDLLNRADSISANQDTLSTQLASDKSKAEDLDMIQGASDFQNQQTGYQAALQSYASVQKLSLFNFLS